MDRVTGRRLNAIGGGLFIVMVLSGIVLWWQGRSRWNEGLQIKRVSSHSFVWQLHSFLGFWSLLLLFVWGITAIYFAFPQPFEAVIDAFDNDLADFERPDGWLLFMIDLHFGRFRGSWPWLPYLWVILGLLPAVMFISGFILWYRRVLKKSLKF
ncbi:MAG: PepSY domain-containing protein, partial [Pseudohongiellaceae bacterium]